MKSKLRGVFLLTTICALLVTIPLVAFSKGAAAPFSDVAETQWYYDAICYVYENGLMNGTSDSTFSPNQATGRGMVVTLLTVYGGWNIFLAIFVALLSCAVAGIINGVLIHDGKLPPFIATMGMMTIVRAVILLISDARNISGLDKAFTDFAKSTVGFPGVDQFGNPTTVGIPVMALVWVILIIISWLMFRYTTFGRNVFACGSNVDAARLSGISVRKTTYGVYLLSGVYCGIGGILLTSRMASGIPTLGDGYEMDAIAMAVFGGILSTGGKGNLAGGAISAFIIVCLRVGLGQRNIHPQVILLILGVLLIGAVALPNIIKQVQRSVKK